ncbi:MAG: hypothetical protein HN863_11815, partial [Marinovum sp.]|nr:hypothetical protein [Marinovum sp.]
MSPRRTPIPAQEEPGEVADENRVLLIACGALAREILAITKGHSWHHMDLTCLPALLHNAPDK